MKKIIFSTIIVILIFLTSIIKSSTKKVDIEIFDLKEDIRLLNEKYELVLLDHNYLSSPKKLDEYQKKYFENDLEPIDIRDISELSKIGDEKATLALKIYSYRIKKYLGAYLTLLPNLDTLIFTAGIGENSTLVREMILKDLNHLGIHLDQEKNENVKRGEIQEIQKIQKNNKEKSSPKILVVPTDEEKEIASQTKSILC